ncbi:MAG: hypothetical protein AAGB02_07525 [Pseudomonadota bacterium]
MSEDDDRLKTMKRFSALTGIIGAVALLAFLSWNVFGGEDGEKACPDGYEMTRTNPPTKTPRGKCVKIEKTNIDAEN